MAILILESAGSTMDVARVLVQSGSLITDATNWPVPAGILALDQTAGRGQRGRSWYSAPGESMCCTLLLPLKPQELQNPGWLAIAAGAAALRSVAESAPPDSEKKEWSLALKWPNDLLLNGKKLGGILIEIVRENPAAPVALVGIGINIACTQFPEDVALPPTSILLEGGAAITAEELAERVCVVLRQEIVRVREEGSASCIEAWKRYDGTTGRRYMVSTEDGQSPGTAVGIDEDGSLLVAIDSGEVVCVHSAAVIAELG